MFLTEKIVKETSDTEEVNEEVGEEEEEEEAEEDDEEVLVESRNLARTDSETTINPDDFDLDAVQFYLTRSLIEGNFYYEYLNYDYKFQSVLLVEKIKDYKLKQLVVEGARKKTR